MRGRGIRLTVAIVVVAGLLLVGGGFAEAGAPTDQLKGAADRVVKLLRDPELGKPGKVAERRKQLRAVADQIFDWQETAKRALGRHWRERTPAEREEFTRLFADLLERAYVGKIELYSGERIRYEGESVEGDRAMVRTILVTRSNTEVPIDYRMLKEGDRWRVYDVTVEGISLVSNYRTQFNRIVQQAGYGGLVEKLKTRQDELVAEGSAQGKKRR